MQRHRWPATLVAATVMLVITGCVGQATHYARSVHDDRTDGVAQDSAPEGHEDNSDDPDPGVGPPTTEDAENLAYPADVLSELEVGDCVRLYELAGVLAVDCALANDGEVSLLTRLDHESLDAEDVPSAAYHTCRDAFADYVGVDYSQTLLEHFPVWVSWDEWADADPQIGCIVGDPVDRTFGRLHDGDLLRLSDEPGNRVDTVTEMPWDKLVAGDCIEEYTDDYAETVVPCDSPHDIQVYGVGELDDATPCEDEAIVEAAMSICDSAFETLPHDMDMSAFEYYDYYPDETTWWYGDRLVQCRIQAVDGPITGSFLDGTVPPPVKKT